MRSSLSVWDVKKEMKLKCCRVPTVKAWMNGWEYWMCETSNVLSEIFLENKEGGRGKLWHGIWNKIVQRCIFGPPTHFWINGVYKDASSNISFMYTKMYLRIKFWHNRRAFNLVWEITLKEVSGVHSILQRY